jgi:quinol monooxygenase YgiN
MSIYSIWESRFAPESAEEGIKATQAIWQDMLSFDGYLTHELVQDLDEDGHLIVVSQWASREAADAALSYAAHPNAILVNALVSEPRRRIVAAAL